MTPSDFLPHIHSFMAEAGALALAKKNTAAAQEKADKSIVTETDLAVTKLAYGHFADFLNREDHVMIDEESLADLPTPQEVFANSTYQWVLDPIDGTTPYALGLPYWNISLAVLKNGQPWLGCIALPALGTTYFTDGETLFLQQADGDPVALERVVLPFKGQFAAQVKNIINPLKNPANAPHMLVALGAGATHLAWTATGQFHGNLFRNCLWDFTAGWALGKVVGLDMRDYQTGNILTHAQDFQLNDRFVMQAPAMMSTEETFHTMRPYLGDKE